MGDAGHYAEIDWFTHSRLEASIIVFGPLKSHPYVSLHRKCHGIVLYIICIVVCFECITSIYLADMYIFPSVSRLLTET